MDPAPGEPGTTDGLESTALKGNQKRNFSTLTRILHQTEAFMAKALRGEAVPRDREPRITQAMEVSVWPAG